MPKRLNIETGTRFGRLEVLKETYPYIPPCGKKARRFICMCSCGKEISVLLMNLRKGKTKSCGCYHKDKTSKIFKKHGMSSTKIYNVWRAMIDRCHNIKDKGHVNYGGRGIAVCDRWRHSFDNFYSDVVGNYKGRVYLDRINNDGDYCPENIRWVSPSESNRNTRKNVKYNGLCLSEWSRILDVPKNTLIYRKKKLGDLRKTIAFYQLNQWGKKFKMIYDRIPLSETVNE